MIINPGLNGAHSTGLLCAGTFVSNFITMRTLILLFALFNFSFALGQGNYRISNFNFAIKGTSNLHNWESSVKEVRANAVFSFVSGSLKSIQSLYVEIPVKTIKSAKGS